MEESEKKSLVAEIAQLVVNTLKPLLPKQEPEGGRTRATDRSWISTHFTVQHPGQGQKSWLARRSSYVAEDGLRPSFAIMSTSS